MTSSPQGTSSERGGDAWRTATVEAVLPRVTLRGEVGAALVLRFGGTDETGPETRAETGAKTGAETGAGAGASSWFEGAGPGTVVVPSRLWPEGADPRGWLWRPAPALAAVSNTPLVDWLTGGHRVGARHFSKCILLGGPSCASCRYAALQTAIITSFASWCNAGDPCWMTTSAA